MADGAAFCGSCGRPIVGFSVGQPLRRPLPCVGWRSCGRWRGRGWRPVYAGFWLRFVGYVIDGLILGIRSGLSSFMMILSAFPFFHAHRRIPNERSSSRLCRGSCFLLVSLRWSPHGSTSGHGEFLVAGHAW